MPAEDEKDGYTSEHQAIDCDSCCPTPTLNCRNTLPTGLELFPTPGSTKRAVISIQELGFHCKSEQSIQS